MRALLFFWILVLGGPAAVEAGPWPREKGQTFLSVTGTYRYTPDSDVTGQDGALYLEYGLTPRLTFGIDAMDNGYDYTHAFAFLRRAVSAPDRKLKLAASIGLGASRRNEDWDAMARIGFSFGRSIQVWKPGWWTVTAAVEDHQLWDDPVYKLETTFGVNLSPRWKTFVDLETSQRKGDPDTITLRGSVAWDTRKRGHLVLGLETKDVNEASVALRAGFWRSF